MSGVKLIGTMLQK